MSPLRNTFGSKRFYLDYLGIEFLYKLFSVKRESSLKEEINQILSFLFLFIEEWDIL
jgi:hypothetical protein